MEPVVGSLSQSDASVRAALEAHLDEIIGRQIHSVRELLPDGDPLELLLVCDTSGSMDSHNRELQSDFIASVLASLGEDDRFNIAVADVDCVWLFDKPVAASEENVKRVAQRLADRPSLGWTDLDRAFASIQRRAGKKSHVVYIGDGVASAGDAGFAGPLTLPS